MATTTQIRAKIITARSLELVARAFDCTVPELLARIAAGDLEALAAWQRVERNQRKGTDGL